MPRTSTILLITGDYAERLDALIDEVREAERASDSGVRRLADGAQLLELRAAYDELRAEAEAAGVKVVLQAIGRREWRRLREKYPPRTEGPEDVVKTDRLAGVNIEAIEDDLVYESLVEPSFDSRAQFDEWADDLSEGEFQTIAGRAWQLVNVARFDPKSLPALPTPTGNANNE